jgi:hypothetical protein
MSQALFPISFLLAGPDKARVLCSDIGNNVSHDSVFVKPNSCQRGNDRDLRRGVRASRPDYAHNRPARPRILSLLFRVAWDAISFVMTVISDDIPTAAANLDALPDGQSPFDGLLATLCGPSRSALRTGGKREKAVFG